MTTISLSLRHAANKTVFAACIAAFCWMPEPLGAQSPFPDENVPETGFMAIFDGKRWTAGNTTRFTGASKETAWSAK